MFENIAVCPDSKEPMHSEDGCDNIFPSGFPDTGRIQGEFSGKTVTNRNMAGSAKEVLATCCNMSVEDEVGWWELLAPGLNFHRKSSHSLSWKWPRWLPEREARAGQSAGYWRQPLTSCWGGGFSFHSPPVWIEPHGWTNRMLDYRMCMLGDEWSAEEATLCSSILSQHSGLQLKQSLLVAPCLIALLSFPSKYLNLSWTTVLVAKPNPCHILRMLGVLCCYYYSPCPLCNANNTADLSAVFRAFFKTSFSPWAYFLLIYMGCSESGH